MMRSLTCVLYILLLTVVQTLAQPLGFTLDDGKKRVDIPFSIHNNLIVIPVLINDALPLRFVVDTGVRTSILTQKAYADILQLPYSRKYIIPAPGTEKFITAYITNNVTLKLPGVTGRGHALLVLEEDYLEMRNFLGVDVHGVLGYELFSRFIVQIDYEKRIMTLYATDKFKPKRKFQQLPIRIEDTKPYLVTQVAVNDTSVLSAKLLIDTGASHGLILEPSSDDRIVLPEKTVQSILGNGLGGEIIGKIGRLRSIQLGDYHLENPLANFPDPGSYYPDTLKSSSVFRNGALGGDIIGRFNIVFDYSKERIFIKKNSSFKKPFYFNLSGITLKVKGARFNKFEVTEVRRGSPGEKSDIKEGDELMSINGISTTELQLNTINSLLNRKPGKKVTLEFLREKNRIKKEIILESQI